MKCLSSGCAFGILLLTIAAIFSFGCAATQPFGGSRTSETQAQAPATAEVELGLVNLRQGPTMSGMIIKVLKKGDKLTVLEAQGGWLHVELEDGTKGWVAKSTTSLGAQGESP